MSSRGCNWTKSRIAGHFGVSPRTIDNWRNAGLLPAPLKLGTAPQSRVRWSDDDVATLEANLRTDP